MKKPTKKPTKKAYTVTEAAQRLRISRAAVHDAIKKGRLDAGWGKIQVVQRVLLIPSKSLEEYRVSSVRQQAGKKTE